MNYQTNTKEYRHSWYDWIIILFVIIAELTSGNIIMGLIIIFVNYACGCRCVKLAERISKDSNIAFIYGMLFSIAGLAGYYVCYKLMVKRR